MDTELANNFISEFKRIFEDGVDKIKKACEIYVKALDCGEPGVQKAFELANPTVSRSMWASFEMVGRGLMHERLIYMNGRAGHTLRRLPMTQQKQALESGVEIMTEDKEVLLVQMENITPIQASLAFASDHIRTPGEQRAVLESGKLKKMSFKKVDPVYKVNGSKIFITGPMQLTKSDLLRMLSEIE